MWSLELMGLCVACMHENCWVHAACTQAFNVAKKRHLNECVLAPRLGTEARTELGLGFKGPSLGTEPRVCSDPSLGSEPLVPSLGSGHWLGSESEPRLGVVQCGGYRNPCTARVSDVVRTEAAIVEIP